jgi:hypothetical protein
MPAAASAVRCGCDIEPIVAMFNAQLDTLYVLYPTSDVISKRV